MENRSGQMQRRDKVHRDQVGVQGQMPQKGNMAVVLGRGGGWKIFGSHGDVFKFPRYSCSNRLDPWGYGHFVNITNIFIYTISDGK